MRRTYWYNPKSGKMEEGCAPRKTHSGDGWKYSDRLYSAAPFKAHDGTVIDSKKKHREYMARNNLTTADDYSNHWAKKAQERAAHYTDGSNDKSARRAAIAKSIAKLEK